jgi:hypothetical protein
MRERYPGALEFLSGFERELRSRAAFRRYFTRRDRSRSVVETGPYWSMFNVGTYTISANKVVWRYISTEFIAAVMPDEDPLPLPNEKLMLVACSRGDEAHYLCAALNSLPVRVFVAGYTVQTQLSTHIVEHINLPPFDPGERVHESLVRASRAAHAAVARGDEPDEDAVDRAAAQLWNLTQGELEAMRRFHDQLRKRDLTAS